MVGLGEGPLDRVLVALFEDETDIVGCFRPHRGRALCLRIGGRGDRGKRRVIDLDKLGGIARSVMGLGDDERHVVAHQPHPLLAERQVGRGEHRRAVRTVARHCAGNAAEPRGLDIVMGIDREHAGNGDRRGRVDRADLRMGVGRTQDVAISLVWPVQVVAVAPAASEQARVFPARHPLADTELRHRFLPDRSTGVDGRIPLGAAMRSTAAEFGAVICGRRMIGEGPDGNNAASRPDSRRRTPV